MIMIMIMIMINIMIMIMIMIIIIIIIMPLFTNGYPFTNTVLSQGAVLFKNMLIEIGKLSI